MTDFTDLEARLDAALENVSNKLAAAAEGNGLNDKLKLETARTQSLSNQLDKARGKLVALREENQALADAKKALDDEIENLKSAQSDLTEQRDKARSYANSLKETQAQLRKQLEANVADPELINGALEQEMAQLKEQHASDLAEVNGILARLTPLVEGGESNA